MLDAAAAVEPLEEMSGLFELLPAAMDELLPAGMEELLATSGVDEFIDDILLEKTLLLALLLEDDVTLQ